MCFRYDTFYVMCGHTDIALLACLHTGHCSSTDYPNSNGVRFPVQVVEIIEAHNIGSRCRECRINHLLLNELEPQDSESIQALIEEVEFENRYWRENGSTVHLQDRASRAQDDPAAIISSRVRRWREERLPLEGFEDYDDEDDRGAFEVALERMIGAVNSASRNVRLQNEDPLDERLTPTEYRFQEEHRDNPIPFSTFLDHLPIDEWRQEAIAREGALAREDVLARENIHTLLNELPLVDLAATPAEDRSCGVCLEPYLRSEVEGVLGTGERAVRLPCRHHFCIACLAEWSISSRNPRFNCPVCIRDIRITEGPEVGQRIRQ